jgi:hypothetical protein
MFDVFQEVQRMRSEPGIDVFCPNCRKMQSHTYLTHALPEQQGLLSCKVCDCLREEGHELAAYHKQQKAQPDLKLQAELAATKKALAS